jgi:hypothetical protein
MIAKVALELEIKFAITYFERRTHIGNEETSLKA